MENLLLACIYFATGFICGWYAAQFFYRQRRSIGGKGPG